jgi:nucleoside-diphosphate-sugar epimerase
MSVHACPPLPSPSSPPWLTSFPDAQDFPAYLSSPSTRKRNAWSYIDARDLGQICNLCINKNGLGFQIFNATNDTITVRNMTTKEFLAKEVPHTKVTREMGEFEAPLSNRKIREVLGYVDGHNWRDYVK